MVNGYVGIPTSYTPVEYIESSGTQYIDTGFKANNNTRVVFDFIPTSVTSSWGWAFGGRNAYHDADYAIAYTTSKWYTGFGTTDLQPSATITTNTEYLIDKNKNVTTINGTSYTNSAATFQSDYNLLLLGVSDGTTIQHCNAKLYSCKVYDNETLIRDYIPVLDYNNVPCMYEQVEGKFYYNQGAGTFSAGSTTGQPVSIGSRARKITKAYVGIPVGYTPVEYIESSGTQYIDTNISTNSNTKVEIEVMFDNANLQECIWCGRDFNSSNTGINNDTLFKFANGIFRVDYGPIGSNFSHSVNAASKYKYVQDKNKLYENDVLIYTSSATTFTTTNKLRLLAARNGDGSTNNFFNGKIYSIKIYDNDTLVGDFIPILDDNNVACLYELVEGKFYYNAGTGSFTAGSVTGQTVSLGSKARRIKKGYVGVNGVARRLGGQPQFERKANTGTITHAYTPAVVETKDYILIAGGQDNSSTAPVSSVAAYTSSLATLAAANMPTESAVQGAVNFNGVAIIAGGRTWTSGSSRTNQVLAYGNNLTMTRLADLYTQAFEPASGATNVHFIITGGSNYNSRLKNAISYSTSYVKTTLTNSSIARSGNQLATIGQYIVCCGGYTTGVTDFYDNDNVKTTSSDPYSKKAQYVLGLSLNDYAVFFGGSTNASIATAFTDCKAYDKNKVLHSFSLPVAIEQAHGFSTGEYAAFGCLGNRFLYNNNLVLEEYQTTESYVGRYGGKGGAANDSFGIILDNNNNSELRFNLYIVYRRYL